MTSSFYEKAGKLLSPGDIFNNLPSIRVPKPLRAARKVSFSLPSRFSIKGELRDVFDPAKHSPDPPFGHPGEEVVVNGRLAKVIFLTWGSEVEQDERHGSLNKKDWLVAPVFSLDGISRDAAETIKEGKSPRFFPLAQIPDEGSGAYYVDFRKICPLAATHFQELPRQWRLAPAALNDFYHQLLWFFTRKRIFFGPMSCSKCGSEVDLGVVFEGQPINPEEIA
jgi:hypothetical protein